MGKRANIRKQISHKWLLISSGAVIVMLSGCSSHRLADHIVALNEEMYLASYCSQKGPPLNFTQPSIERQITTTFDADVTVGVPGSPFTGTLNPFQSTNQVTIHLDKPDTEYWKQLTNDQKQILDDKCSKVKFWWPGH